MRPALRPHGSGRGDRRPKERLQPQPPTLHRQHRAGGLAGHRRPPARRHPRTRPRCPRRLLETHARATRRAVPAVHSPRLHAIARAHRRGEGRHLRPSRVHRFPRLRHRTLQTLAAGQHPASDGLRARRPPEDAHRLRVRKPTSRFQSRAAARCLRRFSAPHGLLGGDPAGRRLPHRRRRLEGGREAARDSPGEKQGEETSLA